MFAICVESSHGRGMGHLFRQLNFAALLSAKGEKFFFVLNDDAAAVGTLAARGFQYETADLTDYTGGWEKELIAKYGVRVWIDDRLDTDSRHAAQVKEAGALLAVFDDRGSGARSADFNFSALRFQGKKGLEGKRIFTGTEYLILNAEIDRYKRLRTGASRILVTMGGSDTYGVTIKVVRILKAAGLAATIIVGPSFRHWRELEAEAGGMFTIKKSVASLIAEFESYDLAITGGGITPFEANASGLPCMIIANELFEIPNAEYLAGLGASVYAGYHERIDASKLTEAPDPAAMSRVGMSALNTGGAERIYRIISNV